MSQAVRRSVLFTPGNRTDRWLKVVSESRADVAVLDLEDAVPVDEKASARKAVAEALVKAARTRTQRAVRINAWPSVEAARDLDALPKDVDLVVVPKVERADDVSSLDKALQERGITAKILLIVETARGVLHVDRFPPASARVVALGFGAEDYAAHVGARRTRRATEVLWARSRVVAAAAAFGVAAIDQVFVDWKDAEGLAEECRFAAQLGFSGKMLIHPDQVRVAHEAFAPTAEDLAWAEKVLAAVDAAGAHEGGVVAVDGKMVDRPLIEQAKQIREWAKLPV